MENLYALIGAVIVVIVLIPLFRGSRHSVHEYKRNKELRSDK